MERGLAAPTTLCASPITQCTQQGLQQASFSSHSSPTELTLTHPFPPSLSFLFFFPAEPARGGNGGMERRREGGGGAPSAQGPVESQAGNHGAVIHILH